MLLSERLSKDNMGGFVRSVWARILLRICGPIPHNPAQSQEEWSKLQNRCWQHRIVFNYTIVMKESGKALGTFALMRIDRNNRVIEVGARPILS